MKLSRLPFYVVLLASLSCLVLPAFLSAEGSRRTRTLEAPRAEVSDASPVSDSFRSEMMRSYHSLETLEMSRSGKAVRDQGSGGIKEQIPDKYKSRYAQWKKEFLATELGKKQWSLYEANPNFTLTIVVSRANNQGAGTGQYNWDDSGKLVAATITLGSSLNQGYPNPIYYPVMNSLTPQESSHSINGETLAATKMAHEFGHLTRTSVTDPTLYQLQFQMIPAYNKILMSNGRNTGDPRLVEMARQMGGTPVEIWEDREYWGETNAMMYLRDRFTEDDTRCALFNRIKQSVDLYAKSYAERFVQIAQSTQSPHRCGWQ